ncbi:MAG: biotin/lipoyl-binding protein, partial [Alphaproteobacteria bacterium]|nr:biotin/lipoyl-binding protein [Alphaproteobacteria bacterium]
MKSFFKYLLLMLPAFLLGAGIVYYIERKHPLKTIVPESIPTVDVIAVTPQTATTTRKYIGYVTPINQAAITPFINGYIEHINVSGGQFVQNGDLLFVIEQDTYLAELDLTRASVLSATAQYEN